MANILVGGVNLKTLGMHGGVANAKNYGALANDTYDNSGIVQALIDAWELLDGGTIVFPASQEGARYRFTTGVINDSIKFVNFAGTGASPANYTTGGTASVLWLDSATDDAALIKYAFTGAASGGQIVERLTLMGNFPGAGANQSGIVFAGRCNNHTIRNCGFHLFTGYAVAHDPTVGASYHQNAAMRDCHFWSVGGCFGPTVEYTIPSSYLFSTLYTFDNVGLDVGIYGGITPKPFIWDFRSTRSVVCTGVFLIEGAGLAGMTAAVALSTGGAKFEKIHYEITSNDPDHLFALYGNISTLSDGASTLKIGEVGIEAGVGIWFENISDNEKTVEIGRLTAYAANEISDLFEWEDGINVNSSGHVTVGHLETKNLFPDIPETYRGRVKLGMVGADHQSRIITNQSARLLFRWNANDGSMLGDWGEVVVNDLFSTIASHAIEADGNFLCQRFTGEGVTYFLPHVRWQIRGDIYEGATVTIAISYRCTVNAADSGITPLLYSTSANITDVERTGLGSKNLTDYTVGVATGILLDGNVDPNRFFEWSSSGGTPTVPVVIRMTAVEIWLGQPSDIQLVPARIGTVPTFGAADATPTVAGFKTWKTGTSGLTITDLDDFPAGEERTIISKGAIVFDTTGTNLVGSSVDITTASGDITRWVSEDGTTKRLLAFVDVSVDNSAGA